MMYGTSGNITIQFGDNDPIDLDLPGTQFTTLGNPVIREASYPVPSYQPIRTGLDDSGTSFTVVMANGRASTLTKIVQIRGYFSKDSQFKLYVKNVSTFYLFNIYS